MKFSSDDALALAGRFEWRGARPYDGALLGAVVIAAIVVRTGTA